MLERYRLLVLVALVTAALDQGSKVVALTHLSGDEVVSLLGDVVDLRLRLNPGLGFGLGAEASEPFRRLAVPAASLAVGVVLVAMYRKLRGEERGARLGVALVVGGGLGNLVDRVRLGHVVDFLAYHLRFEGWTMSGTFNLADVALIGGVATIAVGLLGRGRERRASAEETR